MHVVHIGNLPLTPDHPDHGRIVCHPGRWVLNHALAQKAHTSIEPEIVVQVPGTPSNHITEWDGIRVHYLAAPDRFRSATMFRFDARRIGRYVLGLKPDFVHAHGTEEANLLAAQWTGLPHIVTAQGLYSQINAVMPPKLISRARVVEWVERRSLKCERHIIAKSDYVADWIKSQYPHLEIHRIPNTFDPRLLDIPIPEKEPGSIAFVGMITPRKGLHLLAEALDQLKIENPKFPLSLHIFGNAPNPSDYEQSTLDNLRSTLGDRLHLHGRIPAADLAHKLAPVQFLVAPSVEEMFGNQVIEATLLRAFPIVSSGTAMAENVQRFGFGSVFENNDPRDLARALSNAFESQPSTASISGSQHSSFSESRRRLLDSMGPEAVARAHHTLYITMRS